MDWKQEVLAHVKPSPQEQKLVESAIAAFLKKLNSVMGDAHAILGGSGAKGTWLKDQHDADIFILFPPTYKTTEVSAIAEQRMKRLCMRYEKLHGSRDYFRFHTDNIFEVVPLIDIKKAEDAFNITDVSPLHARWVKKNSTEKIRDDIRIAKAFCKAQGIYGAESYIRGFSGYVLETLVIHYGSFEKLLKAAISWKENDVIDCSKLYKNKNDALMSINEAKLQSPLIVVDPVDKKRNAAAALSVEKWLIMKKKAAQFLKKPSIAFFEKERMTLEHLKKKGKSAVWIEAMAEEGQEDRVGTRLLGAFELIKENLSDFGVASSGWEWDKKAVFWFVLKKKKRAAFYMRKGPPLAMKEHAAQFMKKHPHAVKKKGALWAKIAQTPLLGDVVKEAVNGHKEKLRAAKFIIT